jgi:hypothetical protein
MKIRSSTGSCRFPSHCCRTGAVGGHYLVRDFAPMLAPDPQGQRLGDAERSPDSRPGPWDGRRFPVSINDNILTESWACSRHLLQGRPPDQSDCLRNRAAWRRLGRDRRRSYGSGHPPRRRRGRQLFDTVQAYGFGASERLLAKAVVNRPRDQVVIATKEGPPASAKRECGSGRQSGADPPWRLREPRRARHELTSTSITSTGPISKTPFEKTARRPRRGADGRLQRNPPVETLRPPYHLFPRDIEASTLPYAQCHQPSGPCSMVLLPTGEDQTFGSTATVNSQGGSWLGQTDH